MSSAAIYTGIWTDWGRGRVDGLTLTLSQKHSGYLQSFLAILVTFAGAQLWKIAAYIIHTRGTGKPLQRHDLIHQQRQVILRNTHSAGNTIADLVLLIWAWKSRGVKMAKFWGLLLVPTVILAGFSVAGIFTGEITKSAGTKVLVRSDICGSWLAPNSTFEGLLLYNQKIINDTLSAANYVSNCYDSSKSSSLKCNSFAQQALPYTTQYNVSCPFDNSLCSGGSTAAVAFDTGLLDSNDDLGINAPPKHRVQVRRRTVCSPLALRNQCQAENVTFTDNDSINRFVRCYTGPTSTTNYTFSTDTSVWLLDSFGYQLQSFYSEAGGDASVSTWQPIAELNRTDADVSLFYLAQNSVIYEKPVYDPFFSAHTKFETTLGSTYVNITTYTSDYWIDAMGCTDQYQFCNPASGHSSEQACSPLTAPLPLEEALTAPTTGEKLYLSMNLYQLATALRIMLVLTEWDIKSVVNSRGPGALKANDLITTDSLLSPGLPDDQWVIETSTWFAQSLAATQSGIVQYATGPGNTELEVVAPLNKWMAAGCKNQLVANHGAYQNFSALGLAIVVGLSGFIILLSYVVRPLTEFCCYRGNNKRWHKQLWNSEDKLHLQRLAYQGAGYQHGWNNIKDDVPVSMNGAVFEDVSAIEDRMGHQAGTPGPPNYSAEGTKAAYSLLTPQS